MTDRSDSGGVGTETPSREACIADLATAMRLPLDEVTDTVGFLLNAGVSPGWVLDNYPDIRRVLTEDGDGDPLSLLGRTVRESFILDAAERGSVLVYRDAVLTAGLMYRYGIDRAVPKVRYAVGWVRLVRDDLDLDHSTIRTAAFCEVLRSPIGHLDPEDPDTVQMVRRLVRLPVNRDTVQVVPTLLGTMDTLELPDMLDRYDDEAIRCAFTDDLPRDCWEDYLRTLDTLRGGGVPDCISHDALTAAYRAGRSPDVGGLVDGWNTVQEVELPDPLAAALLGVDVCAVENARNVTETGSVKSGR